MNVVIFDYENKSYDTEIPLNDVQEIMVDVVSGDEILHITGKQNKSRIDAVSYSGKNRLVDFYDGSYVVTEDQLKEWNKRTDSYDWVYSGMNGKHQVYGTF